MMKISKRHLSVIGNVGKEPKRSAMPSGESVAQFSVATSYSHPDGSGGYADDTEWTDCKLYGEDRVNTLMKHVGSGIKIAVEGHLRTEKYTKNGQEIRKEILIVDTYYPLSKKKSHDANEQHAGLEMPEH